MELLFLGTGAADWEIAKHKNLEGFRCNSSLLIDGCLLIDPGRDVPDAIDTFGVDRTKIKYIINTHMHGDHFSQATVDSLADAEFYPMLPGESLTLGRYTITALVANHRTCRIGTPVHFIISDGEKSLFYGLDGAWLTYEEYKEIRERSVDLAVFDATIGDVPGDLRIFEHNNLNMVREIKTTLAPYIRRIMISHLAKDLHGSQSDVEESLKNDGIEVAYDGFSTVV